MYPRFDLYVLTILSADAGKLNLIWPTFAFQKAVDVSTTAVGKGNALNMLGWIAFQKAEYAKAKALSLQAIASDPDQYWAHNSLGACLVKEGDLAGAVAEFQKSVEVNSKASDSEAEARVAKAQKNLDEVQ